MGRDIIKYAFFNMFSKMFVFFLSAAIFLISVLLTLTLLLTHTWLSFEYSHPNFPADILGMSADDRWEKATATLQFIQPWSNYKESNQNQLSDFYTPKELAHLKDVQSLVKKVYVFSSAVLIFLAVMMAKIFYKRRSSSQIKSGGIISLLIQFITVGLSLTFWNIAFEFFHQLFFEPGTWQYYETDMLIRLFPPQFWFDSGLALFGLSLLIQTVLWLIIFRFSLRTQTPTS